MNQRWRMITYVLINILVSACVTGSILYFYDRTSQAACISAVDPMALLAPVPENIQLEIVSVIGAGVASSEIVAIQNNGQEAVFLTGWYLQDDEGDTYTFPQLSLNPGAVIQVHTVAGVETAIDLYWGRSQSVWKSGEVATLLDPQGTPHAFYRIP